MSQEAGAPGGGAVPLHEIYLIELRSHALALVWLGFLRLAPATFGDAEEDSITGELVQAMRAALEAVDAPPWADRYSVSEQVRLNQGGQQGKRRPIVDVEFERHGRGRRPRMPFEAKRLGRGVGVSEYLGPDGLGAFLDGDYPTTHGEAGMLGYVQRETPLAWSAKLRRGLDRKRHRLRGLTQWMPVSATANPRHVYETLHEGPSRSTLRVTHVLLSFAAGDDRTSRDAEEGAP